IAERLRAAMDAGDLNHPGGRPGVETRFANSLQGSAQKRRDHSERQQISDTREGATHQAGQERDLAPAAIGERTRKEAGRQCDKRERAYDEPDGLIGPSEIVTDMRRQSWQHGSDAEEPEKCRSDKRPEPRT